MRLSLEKYRWPYREDRLFSILAFLTFVVPLAFSFEAYENFEMVKFTLWLLFVGWALVEFWRSGKTANLKGSRWIFLLLASLLAWAILSAVFSADWLNSLFGFYYRFTSGLLFYGTWVLFLLLLLKVLDKERALFLAKILVFDALIVALWGFLNSLGIGYYESLAPAGFERAPGLLGNPNFSTMFLACLLPFAIVLGFKSNKFSGRIYYFLVGILIILANVTLASRGALLGLFAGLAVGAIIWLWHKFSLKRFGIVLVITGLFLALGIAFVQVARPSALKPADYLIDKNVSLRFVVWKASLRGIAERPLLGMGPGNFVGFFERYRSQHLDYNTGIFDDAHNLFLQMGETTGLPFVLSFIALLGLGAAAGLRRFKQHKDLIALAALSSLVVFAVAASFTPVSIPNQLILAVILASLLWPQAKEYVWKIPKAVRVSGLAAGAALMAFGICLITAEYLFAYGYRAFFRGDYQRAYVLAKAAQTINPTNSLYFTYRIGSEVKLGRPAELLERHIRQLVNMHPAQARSMVAASNLYSLYFTETGNRDYLNKAIENLQESLKLDSMAGERYSELGLYYYELGDLESSKHYLFRGLDMRDKHLPSLILLARIFQQENNRGQALDMLERAYRQNPDNMQVKALWQFAKQEPDIKRVPIQIIIKQGYLE